MRRKSLGDISLPMIFFILSIHVPGAKVQMQRDRKMYLVFLKKLTHMILEDKKSMLRIFTKQTRQFLSMSANRRTSGSGGMTFSPHLSLFSKFSLFCALYT